MEFFDGYIDFPRNIAVGDQGKLIDQTDFEKFAQENGNERALGYLQAMNDFTAYAETILGGGFCRNGVPESAHMVNKHLKEMTTHNREFLKLNAEKNELGFKSY